MNFIVSLLMRNNNSELENFSYRKKYRNKRQVRFYVQSTRGGGVNDDVGKRSSNAKKIF